jgi:DamX protein
MTDQAIHHSHETRLVPYLDLLGLEHTPFIDENTGFYSNPELNQQLNLIHHLLESSNLIILLLGKRGTGKSTLLRQTEHNANPNWVTTHIKTDTEITDEVILRALANTCNLPTDCGKTALLHLLDEQFANMEKKGRLPVLLVDDAHQATADALRLLTNCATGIGEQNGKCHIVVAAEPELEEKFGTIEITTSSDERFHTNRTIAFTSQQTRDYVLSRLQNAGMTDDKLPLIEGCLDSIYDKSKGIPAEINRFSHLALMDLKQPETTSEKYVEKQPVPEEKRPRKIRIPISGFMAGLFAVLGIASILFLQEQINTLFEPDSNTATPDVVEKSPATTQDATADLSGSSTVKSLSEPDADRKSISIFEPVKKDQLKTKEDSSATREPDISGEKFAQSVKEPPLGINTSKTISSKADDNATPVKTEKPPTPTREPEPAATKPSTQKQPVKKTDTKTAKATSKPGSLPDKDWILGQDPAHFSLQILGSRNEQILKKYIDANKIAVNAKRYKVLFKGNDWHVLIYGSYKTREHAKSAIRQLPKSIQANKPWIRTFKDIQAEIRKGTK